MVSSMLASVCAILAISQLANGHLIINSPVPFGKESLNNSPLVDTAIGSATSDYPCKQRAGVYDITQMNNMTVGQTQKLSFTGSATHGGGTCQLAISLDKEPTASSVFKLIKVYEGGCPTSGTGNDAPDTYDYSIPASIPNGQVTLAWTWFNHVGNREIYMNCAPVSVTGGADNDEEFNALPNQYIINLPTGADGCTSVEGTDVIIPNPGKDVEKKGVTSLLGSATGAGCAAAAAAQTAGGSGSSNGGGASGAPSGYDGASSSAAAAPTSAAAPTNAGPPSYGAPTSNAGPPSYGAPTSNAGAASNAAPTGYAAPSSNAMAATSEVAAPTGAPMLTLTTLATVVSPSSAAAAAAPSSAAPPSYGSGSDSGSGAAPPSYGSSSGPSIAPAAPSSGASPETGSSSGSAGTVGTCSASDDGTIVCNGTDQFGLCNFGAVVWQAVAAGTQCQNGAITRRDAPVRGRARRQAGSFRA